MLPIIALGLKVLGGVIVAGTAVTVAAAILSPAKVKCPFCQHSQDKNILSSRYLKTYTKYEDVERCDSIRKPYRQKDSFGERTAYKTEERYYTERVPVNYNSVSLKLSCEKCKFRK